MVKIRGAYTHYFILSVISDDQAMFPTGKILSEIESTERLYGDSRFGSVGHLVARILTSKAWLHRGSYF